MHLKNGGAFEIEYMNGHLTLLESEAIAWIIKIVCTCFVVNIGTGLGGVACVC